MEEFYEGLAQCPVKYDRRLLIIQVAKQIVEDVQDDVFEPLEVLLEDVPSIKLEAFIPEERVHELAKSTEEEEE